MIEQAGSISLTFKIDCHYTFINYNQHLSEHLFYHYEYSTRHNKSS